MKGIKKRAHLISNESDVKEMCHYLTVQFGSAVSISKDDQNDIESVFSKSFPVLEKCFEEGWDLLAEDNSILLSIETLAVKKLFLYSVRILLLNIC